MLDNGVMGACGGVAAGAILLLAGCNAGSTADGATATDSAVVTAGADTSAGAPAIAAKCAPGNDGLTLPAGFCATVFAKNLGAVRHITVAPNGDLFANVSGGRRATGPAGIVALRDRDGDGVADTTARIGSASGTGIVYHDGMLFADAGPTIVRWRVPAGSLIATGAAEPVVTGLPGGGHSARTMAIGAGNALFVNVGSASNSCQVQDRGNRSPGEMPCRELATRAGTWRYSTTGTNQPHVAGARFATGIRNGMGLAVHPSGTLHVTQHGRDQLTQNWGRDEVYGAENPGEVLLAARQGDDFGWPHCYYSHETKSLVLAPEYGGDGTAVGRCSTAKREVAAFPGHWAPMSILFYSGRQLPARYRNGAFIAFHGSWNRAPQPQAGYNVVFQPMDAAGKATGNYEVFANGFAGADVSPGGATHRPIGLAQAPDGGIYISDDKGGSIWKIVYTGAR